MLIPISLAQRCEEGAANTRKPSKWTAYAQCCRERNNIALKWQYVKIAINYKNTPPRAQKFSEDTVHAPSKRASVTKHHANKVDCVLGAQLFHDMQAMDLDGSSTDAKISCGFLAGSGGYDLVQYIAFALRGATAGGEGLGWRIAAEGTPAIDCLTHTRDHCVSPDLLFQEIISAVFDRLDCGRDVAAARHDEDRRRIVPSVEFLEDIQSGFSGHK